VCIAGGIFLVTTARRRELLDDFAICPCVLIDIFRYPDSVSVK